MPPADPAIQRRRHEFGDQLRRLRLAGGLTQEALAAQAGLDRSFYVEVETGRHSLLLDRVFAISDALGLPIADLFAAEARTE